MLFRTPWIALISLTLLGMAGMLRAETATDEGLRAYLMDEQEEVRLAATAGPEGITRGASYHVLRPQGFVKVKDGTNGFHCFVERSWTGPAPDNSLNFNPRVRAPHCINPEGARTTMQEIFLISRLALAGKTPEDIRDAVDRAYSDGTLTLPTELSLTYMMSGHQFLGDRVGAWHPHVMLWIPYLTEQQVGSIAGFNNPNAFLAGKPGSRRSVLVFPVPQFIE